MRRRFVVRGNGWFRLRLRTAKLLPSEISPRTEQGEKEDAPYRTGLFRRWRRHISGARALGHGSAGDVPLCVVLWNGRTAMRVTGLHDRRGQDHVEIAPHVQRGLV